jgi:hypothetical protein
MTGLDAWELRKVDVKPRGDLGGVFVVFPVFCATHPCATVIACAAFFVPNLCFSGLLGFYVSECLHYSFGTTVL